jgi:hypothetical protein
VCPRSGAFTALDDDSLKFLDIPDREYAVPPDCELFVILRRYRKHIVPSSSRLCLANRPVAARCSDMSDPFTSITIEEHIPPPRLTSLPAPLLQKGRVCICLYGHIDFQYNHKSRACIDSSESLFARA